MNEVVFSITEIIKRNGSIAGFDIEKIFNAIRKAGESTGEFGEDVAQMLCLKTVNLVQQLHINKTPTVENIQDCVEEILLSSTFRKTAKAFIIYRDQHAKLRELSLKSQVDLMDGYLDKTDWQVNENSNMGYSLQGLNNYISSEVSKIYWLNKIYPKGIREAHLSGDFHLHDLGLLSVYCVGWDLYDLLVNGFQGASGKIESKPAKHFRSVLGQVVNFFYTLQGEAAGAQAFSNFDTLLAPFIRYDNLTYADVKQAMQEFLFNVNIPTRVGFQTPFTNVTLDLNVPSYYADKAVIIGGEMQSETYAGFQHEMDIFNRAFLEVMKEGDAKGRVFTFPIPTYNISDDFDWDNPMLEILWDITAKYGIPYFANFINSDMKPEDARSMCCRLRIDNRELNRKGGGHVGLALSNQMELLGFYVVVFDNRADVQTINENKSADEIIIASYDEVGSYIEEGEYSYTAIVTSALPTDKIALKQIIHKKLRYIGLMGSESKLKRIFNELEKEGIKRYLLNKINAPIGLEIKSNTVEEIAVSIAAQIITVKNSNN